MSQPLYKHQNPHHLTSYSIIALQDSELVKSKANKTYSKKGLGFTSSATTAHTKQNYAAKPS